MRVLITGNMGYVGPSVVKRLRERLPGARINGLDTGFFAHCLTTPNGFPERRVDCQYFRDVRQMRAGDLAGYDCVIMLAAISNDPMGAQFERVTYGVNRDAALDIARMASAAGVKHLVFASSCSVYGVADGRPRREDDPVNPMTAYAVSKADTERGLAAIGGDMIITSLRFATACGMSDRLRLDLVLNDFVATALTTGRIKVLSDGTPWRPLIDVADMARAIEWAATRPASQGGRNLVVNAGIDSANYQVSEIARAVSMAVIRHNAVPTCEVSINRAAPADSRSYQVDFSRFAELAPEHQPQMSLDDSISELVMGLREIGFANPDFRESPMIRLQVLKSLMAEGLLAQDLTWSEQTRAVEPTLLVTELTR